ncbi:hypothetical protein [Burkholderia metallica]
MSGKFNEAARNCHTLRCSRRCKLLVVVGNRCRNLQTFSAILRGDGLQGDRRLPSQFRGWFGARGDDPWATDHFFCCSNLVLTQATSLDTMGRIAVFACRGALVRYAFLATLVAQECVEWEHGCLALFFSRGNGIANIR